MRSGWAVEVQHASDEIADGDAQVAPEAALQAGIVLSAAEEVAHQLPENRAASDELHHARGYGGSEKRAAIETADDARGKFQLGRECGLDPGRIFLRAALRQRTAKKLAGADCVEQPFASERIDPGGGVADQRPVLADNVALRKRALLRRGQDVAVELCAFRWKVLLLDKRLQMPAKLRAGMRGHAAADSDREMIAARERKSTRLNSSHGYISYAVFCLKKKKPR